MLYRIRILFKQIMISFKFTKRVFEFFHCNKITSEKKKNFKTYILRKLTVECKSELGIGVQNKGKSGNRKWKYKNFGMEIDIKIDSEVGIDSVRNFTLILCLRYFF